MGSLLHLGIDQKTLLAVTNVLVELVTLSIVAIYSRMTTLDRVLSLTLTLSRQ